MSLLFGSRALAKISQGTVAQSLATPNFFMCLVSSSTSEELAGDLEIFSWIHWETNDDSQEGLSKGLFYGHVQI